MPLAHSSLPVVAFVTGPPDSAASAAAAAAAAARYWSLSEPVYVRTGMNVLFAAGDDVLLRVGRITAPARSAVELADLLTAHGIRVPRLERRDPFEFEGLTVFAYRRERTVGPIDWTEVGRMVARVHQLSPDQFPASYPRPWCGSFPWWNLATTLDELHDLIDEPARQAMREVLERHGDWHDHVGNAVVCHGDLHPGNVVQSKEGPVLLDWDLLCAGPAAWDHAPLMTWSQRWGGDADVYDSYAAGFGRSFRDDRVAESLAVLRLLAATLMRLRAGRSDVTARTEAELRLRWWRGEPGAPPWHAA